VVVKVLDPGMQAQEFFGSFPPLESKLLPILMPCRSVGLLNNIVAAGRPDHLLMVNAIQAGQVADGGLVAPQLIRVDHLWDVIFTQQPRQKGFRCISVSVPLKQNALHEAVLVHTPPEPVSNAIHHRADLVQRPPGTLPRFPVAQSFCKQRAELDAPFANGFMTDHNAALVQ